MKELTGWAKWFYGEEAMESLQEMEHREETYQAFKGRLVEELNDHIQELLNETSGD